MSAYYNEIDKNAASWLRQLIKMKLITDGEVDDRSITDVQASDVRGFRRLHFFAGIAGWERALQIAGWRDDKPVVTASLPCQPFSVAGAGKGVNDERHLLPHFIELVKQCNFGTIFGEQVPGAIKHGWLDDLCFEMERENYAVGSIVLTAAGAGAPHIRQRLYWVANSNSVRRNSRSEASEQEAWDSTGINIRSAYDERMADSIGARSKEQPGNRGILRETSGDDARENTERSSGLCGMVHTNGTGSQQGREFTEATRYGDTIEPTSSIINDWTGSEWLYCRDNKYRPIKPGIKPLVYGVSGRVVRGGDTSTETPEIDCEKTQEARVMRLKGYGNSIVPQVAAQFISAFIAVT